MDGLGMKLGIHGMAPMIPTLDVRMKASHVSAMSRDKSAVAPPPSTTQKTASRFSFKLPLRSLWRGGGNERYGSLAIDDAIVEDDGEAMGSSPEGQNGNWVSKILLVNSMWREKQRNKGVEELEAAAEEEVGDRRNGCDGGEVGRDGCQVCDADDEEQIEFDRDSFSRLLRRVSLTEAKLYAQMSYLGNLAYSIPNIKPGNLLKYRGLRFVTSSVEKKELAAKAEKELAAKAEKELSAKSEKELAVKAEKELSAKSEKELAAKTEKDQLSAVNQEAEQVSKEAEEDKEEKKGGYPISALTAYKIAASAASYLHSQTKSILPFKPDPSGDQEGHDYVNLLNSEVASLKATTDSMTAVVGAKEEEKQAVANNLNSTRSTPCEWFICDDDQSATRFFVIQGSESLESWQANLLFEPVQFEGLDVLVHRGIYEAAKGIYEQMLPEVRSHLKSRGHRATFRFTGHSLGGSLSLLINLMLMARGEVPRSSLLPVVTFGAPSIMCGGDHLLQKLGLPRSHVQAITLHRDIVPRAFSCNYPNRIAELLKAVNGNFRNHPCLDKQKLLYAPMGELLILQPDEKLSPRHHLLPSGSGLFLLCCPLSDAIDADKQLRAAKMVFLNSPHPLEILSDRAAYGAEGTIRRDHDMNSYLKSVRNVIRQELSGLRKARREQRRKVWWPLVSARDFNASIILGQGVSTIINMHQNQFNFSGMVQTGKESLRRFSRLVASQQMHLFFMLLLPVKLLLLGAYSVMNFR